MMLVDSHCHLDFPGLAERLDEVLASMHEHGVGHALCVSVALDRFEQVLQIARSDARLSASVGVHPDSPDAIEPRVETLVQLAADPKVVAIGETGLDYYRTEGDAGWQRERFRVHIRAARQSGKPLIVHMRAASPDTIRLLREEQAGEVGGVLHCFTEDWESARAGLDLGFHVSFSGIVTFRNAQALRDVAARIPDDRLLIETDSPYLAPVPKRGKANEPGWVRYVAECLARVRGQSVEEIGKLTTANFFRLFRDARSAGGAALLGLALLFAGVCVPGEAFARDAGTRATRSIPSSAAMSVPAASQAFWEAVARDDVERVRTLLLRGVDTNAVHPQFGPAILVAAHERAWNVVRELAQIAGTRVDVPNARGETAVMLAALRGNLEIVRLLVDKGAQVNRPGWTPLHYAAMSGNLELLRYLIDQSAYIDAQSPNKTTPLMMAARHDQTDAVRLLIEAGADPTPRNQAGLDAAGYLASNGKADEARWMRERMAEFSRRYGSKEKPRTAESIAQEQQRRQRLEAPRLPGARD